jgi:hypothetical protein
VGVTFEEAHEVIGIHVFTAGHHTVAFQAEADTIVGFEHQVGEVGFAEDVMGFQVAIGGPALATSITIPTKHPSTPATISIGFIESFRFGGRFLFAFTLLGGMKELGAGRQEVLPLYRDWLTSRICLTRAS